MPNSYEKWKSWVEKNPAKRREQKQRWYRKNADRIRLKNASRQGDRVMANREYYKRFPEKLHEKTLKHYYGMTLKDYHAILENQEGKCKICGTHHSDCRQKKLHVDHCHNTDRVRGLLCEHCNRMLGLARDNREILIAAASYLAGGDHS